MQNAKLCRAGLALASVFMVMLLGGAGRAQQQPAAPASGPADAQPKPAASAAPAPPAKPVSADQVIIKAAGQQATAGDLQYMLGTLNAQARQSMTGQGIGPLVDQYVTMLVLAQKAAQDHLEATPDVKNALALQRNEKMAEAEYGKMASETVVTPDEIGQYYGTHKDEFQEGQIRRVFVRQKPEGSKDGTPGVSLAEAKQKATSIRAELGAGKDPKELAKQFKDANEGFIDQEPQTLRFSQLPPEWQKATAQLNVGQVSELVDTPQGPAFIQLLQRRALEQKEVAKQIEDKLRADKLQVVLNNLKSKAGIWVDQDYVKTALVPQTQTPLPPPRPAAQPPAKP